MKLHPKFGKPMATFWDSFEGAYQMGAQKHRVYMLDLLEERGIKTLLDVGGGTMPIFELIINADDKWNFIYKGTDYSFAMVDTAKEMFPHGKFEVQDARNLNEKDNSWDCVLLMHALDHIDDYQSVIREAARVTKKYVCIILWRGFVQQGTNLNNKNMMGKEEGEEPWEDTHLQEYSREVLEEEFRKNNLVIEHEASGEEINSDHSKYNWLVLLKKENI